MFWRAVAVVGWGLLFVSAFASDNMKWIDGRDLPIEGRAFNDSEHY